MNSSAVYNSSLLSLLAVPPGAGKVEDLLAEARKNYQRVCKQLALTANPRHAAMLQYAKALDRVIAERKSRGKARVVEFLETLRHARELCMLADEYEASYPFNLDAKGKLRLGSDVADMSAEEAVVIAGIMLRFSLLPVFGGKRFLATARRFARLALRLAATKNDLVAQRALVVLGQDLFVRGFLDEAYRHFVQAANLVLRDPLPSQRTRRARILTLLECSAMFFDLDKADLGMRCVHEALSLE